MSLKKKTDKLTKELEEQAFAEEQADVETPAGQEEETDLVTKINELERDCADWKDKYLRSMAEFENFRRRSNQEKSDWIKLATQKLAQELCDVADNFERALLQIKPEDKENPFVKGMQMIEQQLLSVLQREGVCKIEALGKEFDPAQHEALAHIPSDLDENLVAAVIQNGYMMHDKVLRPVRVAVSSGPQEEITEDPDKHADPQSGGQGGSGSDTIEIEVK